MLKINYLFFINFPKFIFQYLNYVYVCFTLMLILKISLNVCLIKINCGKWATLKLTNNNFYIIDVCNFACLSWDRYNVYEL